MVTECRSIRESGGLPPRRSELIQAAAAVTVVTDTPPTHSDWAGSINVPLARDRLYEYFEREQLPGDVKSTLAAALNGNLHYQHLLFTAMIDTWPKLQKGINEIARKVSVAPWKIHPFARRGDKPKPDAEALAKEIEGLVWGMKPRAAFMERGLEGTIKGIVRSFYYGHGVSEIRWSRNAAGEWMPRCTKAVPSRYYGYPYDIQTGPDGEDRLMFDPEGGLGGMRFEDFPANRFLVAINVAHEGHPTVAAPLRALTGYWLAAVYGLKWFLNFTQLYGIPWRHAEVGDIKDENAVKNALAAIGANGYIVTKPGTKINILSPGTTAGDSLPQKALIDLADAQCTEFILGQSLTSGVSKDGGSRALGEVHSETLDDVVDGVADFVGDVLTHQLIPAIVALNYGDKYADEMPEMWARREEDQDDLADAERMDTIINKIKVPLSESYVYEELGLPIPVDGDKIFRPAATIPPGGEGFPKLGPDGKPLPDPQPPVMKLGGVKSVKAADATVKDSLTVDQLSTAVLEGLTGVSREWLSPVKPFFDRLAALAMSKQVTDEDFLAALEKAQTQLPEIFDLMDSQALEEAFMNAIGSAALAGSVSRYE